MSELYDIVRKTIESENLNEATSVLFGLDGIQINSTEYYQSIIANFVKKKDLILPKVNGSIVFDLDSNISTIWDIIFISQYIYNRWNKEKKIISERKKQLKKELKSTNDINKKKELETIINELEENENLINIYFQKLDKRKELDKVEIETHQSFDDNSLQNNIIELKKAILIFQKIRDSFEHRNEEFCIGKNVIINNSKNYFKINIPIEYLDGFVKGRIIVREKDSILIKKTNEIVYPLLEKLHYDPKQIESFFYNVEPGYLDFLLKICDYNVENLYKLPASLFYRTNNTKKLLIKIISKNDSNKLIDEDYKLLANINGELKNDYTDNIMYVIEYLKSNNTTDKLALSAIIARFITSAELNPLKKKIDRNKVDNIINNVIKTYKYISNENCSSLLLKELPYDLFLINDDNKLYDYIQNIIFIKNQIFNDDDELNKNLNWYFNCFLENGNLLIYLNEIKDIFKNYDKYFPVDEYKKYQIELLSDITSRINLSANPYKYRKLTDDDKKTIETTIETYKKGLHELKMKNHSGLSSYKKSGLRRNGLGNQLSEIIKYLNSHSITIVDFKEKIINGEIDEHYLPYIHIIMQYEEEINYLLNKTNNNYELTSSIIVKLYHNVNSNTLTDDGKFYNSDYVELYNRKIKENFKRNIDILTIKFNGNCSKLLEFPSEFLYCGEQLFSQMLISYNNNICKSIFGINNPKIIGLLIYMNSVFSRYQKNDSNYININPINVIHTAFNDTYIYKNNITAIDVNQESYLSQFVVDDKNGNTRNNSEIKAFILDKLRNSSAHFRFKLVKDKEGNLSENKIYLYDEYNNGINNFNMIVDIKDIFEITRQVELDINMQKFKKKEHDELINQENNNFRKR